MQFEINRKTLLDELNIVTRAIASFSPLPILDGLKIEAKEDCLVLTGSDSNVSIRSKIKDVEIKIIGEIIIEAKYLKEIVQKSASAFIEFSTQDETIFIQAGRSKFRLNGISSSEYPNIDFDHPENRFKIAGSKLKEIINHTSYAASKNNQNRPVLTGVNIHSENCVISFSATDSYRMAMQDVMVQDSMSFSITVPKKSMDDVVSMINDDVEVFIDDKKIQFICNDRIMQSRLLAGIFPDINRIIPEEYIAELEASTSEIISAIERSSFNKIENVHVVNIEIDESKFMITTRSTEIGRTEDSIEDFTFKGKTISTNINATYLLEALKKTDGERCILKFSLRNSNYGPIKITSKDNDEFFGIVVPVRI